MTNFFESLELLEEQPKQKIEFRLYYDPKTNEPLFYTMEDEPGDYISITPEEFSEMRLDVFVKDGKIEKKRAISIGKLVPSDEGYRTTKNDISIIGNEQYWDLKTYE